MFGVFLHQNTKIIKVIFRIGNYLVFRSTYDSLENREVEMAPFGLFKVGHFNPEAWIDSVTQLLFKPRVDREPEGP